MGPTLFHSDDAAAAWQNLFDFLEPRGRSATDRSGSEASERRTERASPRRERAQARYQEVFCKLTAYFDSRGCDDSEGCASETILRVAAKCGEVELHEGIEPMSFFYGCARNVMHEVYREWRRREKGRRELLMQPAPEPTEIKEARDRCLEDCMRRRLDAEERELILDYYRGERSDKIEWRRRLARARNKGLNALRIETHRIRKKLQSCVIECLQGATENVVTA